MKKKKMAKKKTVSVEGIDIKFFQIDDEDYISLTDITRGFPDGKQLVPRWIRNRDTLDFLGSPRGAPRNP